MNLFHLIQKNYFLFISSTCNLNMGLFFMVCFSKLEGKTHIARNIAEHLVGHKQLLNELPIMY